MGRAAKKESVVTPRIASSASLWDVRSVKALTQFKFHKLNQEQQLFIERHGGPEKILNHLLTRPLSPDDLKMLRELVEHPGLPTTHYVEQAGCHYSTYSEYFSALAAKLAVYLNDGRFTTEQRDEVGEVPEVEGISPSPQTNLPAQWTSFVGREREVYEIGGIIQSRRVRLITLTGPGGTGKTRLSLQVAESLLSEFANGVFFVPLAAIRQYELMVPAIVQALGAPERSGKSKLDDLKEYLRNRQILLVLDNFEHVMPAAPVITELLAAAPHVSVLVTSREILHLYGEQEFEVSPLALPETSSQQSAQELLEYEAIRLFVERAKLTNPTFAFTEDVAPSVGSICSRLEGLPLAIELVAARVKSFTPAEILPRLISRLAFVIGGPRDLPTRQQTLRGAIDWSYQLLSPSEQRFLARLSVFIGGCIASAADVVCSIHNDLEESIHERIELLIDKSLLKKGIGRDGNVRFFMLETIREYASEQLAMQGDDEALIKHQYASYYAELAEEAALAFHGPRYKEFLNTIDAELENIRAVLAWTLSTGNVELALQIGGALWSFWLQRGHINEGRAWIEKALTEAGNLPKSLLLRPVFVAGNLAMNGKDYEGAIKLLERSLSLAKEIGDHHFIAVSQRNLGRSLIRLGDNEQAYTMLQESLQVFEQAGDLKEIPWSMNGLATALWRLGKTDDAIALFENSVDIFKKNGDVYGMAHSLLFIGTIYFESTNYEAAEKFFREALEQCLIIDDKLHTPWLKQFIGYCLCHQGDYTQIGLFKEAILMFHDLGKKPDIASCLVGIAAIAANQKKPEQAARLLGAADTIFQKHPHPETELRLDQHEYDLVMSTLQQQSDKDDLEQWIQAGTDMTIEQAIKYSLKIK